jgi:hypothetical protein
MLGVVERKKAARRRRGALEGGAKERQGPCPRAHGAA